MEQARVDAEAPTWAAVSGEDAGDGAGFLGGEERDDVLEDGVG